MKRFQNAKRILSAALAAVTVFSVTAFSGCSKDSGKWKEKGYDLSVPVLGEDGWYMVFEDDFGETASTKTSDSVKSTQEAVKSGHPRRTQSVGSPMTRTSPSRRAGGARKWLK